MEYIVWPTIQPAQFLPIFIYATLVIVFGAMYAGMVTAARMKFYPRFLMVAGYAMWGLQGWSLYELSVLIQANAFTYKVLVITMIAYLFVPHIYFHLIDSSEKRYDA